MDLRVSGGGQWRTTSSVAYGLRNQVTGLCEYGLSRCSFRSLDSRYL